MRKSTKIWILGGVSVVVLILAVSLPMVGHAHEKGWERGWRPGPEDVICRLDTRLDLTAEQKEKLAPIIDREMEKRREMRQKHRQEMEQLRAKFHEEMVKEREEVRKEFASVLTDDQMKEFEKLTDKRHERWKEKGFRGDHRGPGRCR